MPALLAGSTIFVSAFLLFQLQPMAAKAILPWFGGSAAVWGTCLVFFQAVLFLGYLYAHVLTRKLGLAWQWRIHAALLLASVALLPILPSMQWKPAGDENPALRILLLLTFTVGLPYFLLSSTSPLLQAWYSRSQGGALPYRYFALSNLASLTALLGYPTLVEPWSTLSQQSVGWSGVYIAYVAGCIAAGWAASRRRRADPATRVNSKHPPAQAPRPGERVLWVLLAGFASILSLAVTNHITQNVAPIPFLWVLPLVVYLTTFILCFEGDGWSSRGIALTLHGCALAALALLLVKQRPDTSIRLIVPALLAGLFVCCMFCHGELARRKPAAAHLTQFYLMIALGGALGALSVGFLAPAVLVGSYDLPVVLAAGALFTMLLEYKKWWVTDVLWAAVAVGVFVAAGVQIRAYEYSARVLVRNFYGGLRVLDRDGARSLVHGVVSHGTQFLAPDRRRMTTTYYARGTGVERAIEAFRRPQQRVGVIGLGAGTLAAYAQPRDYYRFYEINPQVIELARSEFSYLSDSAARIETTIGDGRLSLEREAPQNFDVFVIDAFSGDSVPVHLLSREAMELYFRHLRPDGVLAFHVSNEALLLAPMVGQLARSLDYAALDLRVNADQRLARYASEWVLVARHAKLLDRPEIQAAAQPFVEIAGLRPWTDDYSTLFPILK
jgi:SAM-dependent methyltransferase